MAVLPIHNNLLISDTKIYFQIDYYVKMTGRDPEVNEKILLIVSKENVKKVDLTPDKFYPLGMSAVISEVNKNNGYFTVHTMNRVKIENISVFNDGTIDVEMTFVPENRDEDEEKEKERLRAVKAAMAKYAESTQWGMTFRSYMADWDTIGKVASALSPWFLNSNEERYAILSEDSVTKRNEMIEKMIYENLEVLKVNSEAQSAQRADYEKIYRENALKKQISYLQNELDELSPESVSDLRSLEKKIEECGMNETAKKEAKKVLNRLKQEGSSSTESAMLHDYLDFVTGLSWKKEKAKKISMDHARDVLDKEHYGLKKIKKRIIEQIAVMTLKGEQSGSILCFVGAPGTGKTSIGASIANALNRKYIRVSLGGVRDEADIRGHRRTYVGAMPGRIMSGISRSGVSNPVMVLDEVDKMSQSYNGDPAAALLEVLDPEQNSNFTDHYMNVPYDISDVMFICTANSLDTIPEPLLNRMEVIRFDGYTPIEKERIAKDHLIPKAMEAVGLKEGLLEIEDGALQKIIREYTRESGVRGLKKRIDSVCRQAAVNIVTEKEEKKKTPAKTQTVSEDNLRDYIEGHPLHDKSVKLRANPGVVTGLAWTSDGGDILYIETMFTKGAGDMIITGQLGDVMTESAKIAVSLVKSMYPESAKKFKDNTLHIHVPDGATPKDGPSAGITLTTALSSLVCKKSVPPSVAMTGEVSLQGGIGAIGGLSEKLMAAQRSGVKKVFIPKDNEEDLLDVPEEVKKSLTIIPVKTVKEVLRKLDIKKKK